MLNKLKGFRAVIVLSIICIGLCILTFLAFINPNLLFFLKIDLQILLIFDAVLLILFLFIVFKKSSKLYFTIKNKKVGSQTSLRYISLFTLFTFIPSFLIAIFSLFIFNYGLQNFFNTQITKAVNSSYDVARNYLEQNKKTVESDVFLMSVGLNRASTLFYSSPERFKNIARSEKLLRRVDDIFLIDSSANIIFSDTESDIRFIEPSEEEINQALEGLPVLISNNVENKTSAMIKLNSLIDTYLFISRNIDPEIIKYLNETEQAVSFYYTVENKQTGIKITFAIIYILVVALLLFVSTIVAISFADRLTKPIINLITASDNISKGVLDSRVPESDDDQEFFKLNKNFNNMIQRLKKQQDKLLIAERYSAWENVARKLAHEIKNPLTPIQLSIDRLQEKFHKKIGEGQNEFKNYLSTINRQIKDIENLVNEFSSFARMPSPIFKKTEIDLIVRRAVDFYKMSSKNEINFISKKNNRIIKGDEDQLYRVFINLIKNSEDSIAEKKEKNRLFKGKINIEIHGNKDYINVILSDNGIGIKDTSIIMTPYFTTKKNGTGLGLPIVSKIINEHKGELIISKNDPGVKVTIKLPTIS
jgi:two-component system nitrogen regulation sensor histidine kinase NtrY|tara:strand:- start:2702 stop:4471 length:1770 start_codon:yes stop_codon:yes gene_type:complete